MIQMAIMGYGTIGSGVYHVVRTNSEILAKNIGEELRVKYVLDIREFPGDPVEEVLVHDVNIILNDPEVSIVVETMGGAGVAYSFVKQALEAGKSVATSNKELVAAKGAELMALARSKGVNFLFEASVGGGIPIIRPLLTCLTADDIEEVTGILNGTTNYILTRMNRDGSSFEAALKEAQDNGFAEKKPDADVEGWDACRKVAILSSLVLGELVDYEDIYTEGITKITTEDFAYANRLGWAIKLLGTSKKADGKVYAMVCPALVKPEHPLYGVNDVFNGIMVHGNMVDDVMFYGRGAGSVPTASAVVGDVVEIAKNPGKVLYEGWSGEKRELSDIASSRKQFLVRVKVENADTAATVFAGARRIDAGVEGETAFLTQEISEAEYEAAAAQVPGILHRIRVQA
ncbi:MAG: homoserine dehydrogenase [Lachnospiraceae bacterium]|nr:homoserine dehydrogenase [Lachnospiraceae bacterium]